METSENVRFNPNNLSQESKNFINRFKTADQDEYNKIKEKVEKEGIVPVSKVHWMVS